MLIIQDSGCEHPYEPDLDPPEVKGTYLQPAQTPQQWLEENQITNELCMGNTLQGIIEIGHPEANEYIFDDKCFIPALVSESDIEIGEFVPLNETENEKE